MESFYRADYIDVYDRPPLCTNPPLLFSRNRFARWYTGGARFFCYRRNRMVSSAYWIWVVWSCEFTLLTCQAMVEANAFSDELMSISTSTWKESNLRIYSDYKSYWRVNLIFFITMRFSIGSTYRSRSIRNLRRKFLKLLSCCSEMTNYAIESDLKVESRTIINTYVF